MYYVETADGEVIELRARDLEAAKREARRLDVDDQIVDVHQHGISEPVLVGVDVGQEWEAE